MAANAARTDAESATSSVRATARRPSRRAVAAAVRGSMSATATRAPSRANASAIAWPMPRPAPVTSATLFLSRMPPLPLEGDEAWRRKIRASIARPTGGSV